MTDLITRMALRLVKLLNRYKDEGLAWRLFELSQNYARRPSRMRFECYCDCKCDKE